MNKITAFFIYGFLLSQTACRRRFESAPYFNRASREFVVKLVSELAIRDGGHCLHVFGIRLFTCRVECCVFVHLRGRWF